MTPPPPGPHEPSVLNQNVYQQLLQILSGPQGQESLHAALRLLAKWRSTLIQNSLPHYAGSAHTVLSGPFEGMLLPSSAAEGCYVPKILGCYEQPLHPFIEEAVATDYTTVLNIGSAEGYYAIGLARRMSGCTVVACDSNPAAATACQAMAQANAVASRIDVRGLFQPHDFEAYSNGRTLVVCDIEGAERELLDPALASGLRHMDIIVEAHDCYIPDLSTLLLNRFEESHAVEMIHDTGARTLPQWPWFTQLHHLDQLIAMWEWRSGATPWLVMKAKTRAA